MNSHIKSYLDANRIPYEINVDLKKKTWIHRGGIAGIYITPESSEELEKVVLFLYRNNIKFLLVGHTSNIYILNECNIPVVVSTVRCRNYKIENGKIYCEAGVGVISLSKQMIKTGICGFEYLTGLPGTVGAALVNNSSCKTNSISDLLISAKVILKDGTIRTFYYNDFKFEFRNSVFKKRDLEGTIISVILRAEPGDSKQLKKISEENDVERERLLDGHSRNLGCTVNRCFINGKMPLIYRIPLFLSSIILKFICCSPERKISLNIKLLCYISGYKSIVLYISPKNPIIFKWIDEGADAAFPLYLEFMRKVYMTDKVEIEVIK